MHELTHAYDYATARLNLADCSELACSEVRANRNAECRYDPAMLCGVLGPDSFACKWLEKKCTWRTATRATASIFPDHADGCVAEAFRRGCFEDESPFEPKS